MIKAASKSAHDNQFTRGQRGVNIIKSLICFQDGLFQKVGPPLKNIVNALLQIRGILRSDLDDQSTLSGVVSPDVFSNGVKVANDAVRNVFYSLIGLSKGVIESVCASICADDELAAFEEVHK